MKIQTVVHEPVESQGISAQGTFSIKTSSHAFRLLSSGLYTNKIQAVIRELSCNAADAHVMNGNQKMPFDIKLPNGLDSQFYVRDYGPGMSNEDVMKLYTTYFESTKQQSNDFTGGFGVGSKSPFAYTDMFTVVSIHNNLKSMYSAYVDDDDEPKIVRLGESEPTDEPSGLSVGFPVKNEDQRTFQQEAQDVLSWFKSPVNTLGVADSQKPVPFDSKGIIIKSPNVLMFGSKSNGNVYLTAPPGAGTAHANHRQASSEGRPLGTVVMGNVHYPLPFDSSLKDMPEAKWFSENNAVFPVSIGSVSVAASREALAFDKFTKESIKGIVKNAFDDVAKALWKDIEKKFVSKNNSDLVDNLAARQTLHSFKFSDPAIVSIFINTIGATPAQRQLFSPRFLVDPGKVPKTFNLIQLTSSGYGTTSLFKVGSPIEWSRSATTASAKSSQEALDINGAYEFVENGARMHGARVDTAITNVITGLKERIGMHTHRRSIYMIVPHDKVAPAAYEAEKAQWQEYLGVAPTQFSKMGETFKNEGVAALDPYNYNTQSVELLPSTPPFFWMSETEFNKTGGSLKKDRQNYNLAISPRNVSAMQRNLGMKTDIDKIYVVADSDVEQVKKLCPNAYNFIEDFCIKTLMSPKMQKKIGNIKPMMSESSYTLAAIRGRVKREPDWASTLKDSKFGVWLERMQGVKGSMSYDFTTMQVLTHLKKVLGEDIFPSVVPEFYNGRLVEIAITDSYPFLQTHVALRATLGVEQLKHLKSYVHWCEENGSSPPEQALIKDEDISPSP